MTAPPELPSALVPIAAPAAQNGGASSLLWPISLTVAVALHAGGIALLAGHWTQAPEEIAGAPAILVELATITAAPQVPHLDVAPGPQQNDAASAKPPAPAPASQPAPPVIAAATASDPIATAKPAPPEVRNVTPEPMPPVIEHAAAPTKTHARIASRGSPSIASAPAAAEHRAAHASAPAPGAALNDDELPSWKSALVARLERSKRYPAEAQSRGEQGVALLAFSVDGQGGVHRARIAKSSGSALLDRETLALLERAQPLPPPPARSTIAITVPIRYATR